MKTLQEILKGHKVSNYQNSPKTREMVADQIKEIYGEKELQNYSQIILLCHFLSGRFWVIDQRKAVRR